MTMSAIFITQGLLPGSCGLGGCRTLSHIQDHPIEREDSGGKEGKGTPGFDKR